MKDKFLVVATSCKSAWLILIGKTTYPPSVPLKRGRFAKSPS